MNWDLWGKISGGVIAAFAVIGSVWTAVRILFTPLADSVFRKRFNRIFEDKIKDWDDGCTQASANTDSVTASLEAIKAQGNAILEINRKLEILGRIETLSRETKKIAEDTQRQANANSERISSIEGFLQGRSDNEKFQPRNSRV